MQRLSAARFLLAALFIAAAVAGCAGTASGTDPRPTLAPGPVTTPADALARVVAFEPRLAGIKPFDTGLIGQSSSFTVEPASGVGVFVVMVRVGWGDCQAGCISEHSWVYAVGPDGAVSVSSEGGPAVPPDAWPSPIGSGRTGIAGVAVAGPVCPVERLPPDPACAPRPVAGAKIVVRDASGAEVASVQTGADGSFFVDVKAGDYVVEPQPAEGLMGGAATQSVEVVDGSAATIQIEYDTGIR